MRFLFALLMFVALMSSSSVGQVELPDYTDMDPTERCLAQRDGDLMGILICYANDPEHYYHMWRSVDFLVGEIRTDPDLGTKLSLYGTSWDDFYYNKFSGMLIVGAKHAYTEFYWAIANKKPEVFAIAMNEVMNIYSRLLSMGVGVDLPKASHAHFVSTSQLFGLDDNGTLGESLQCSVMIAAANGGTVQLGELTRLCKFEKLPAPPWTGLVEAPRAAVGA